MAESQHAVIEQYFSEMQRITSTLPAAEIQSVIDILYQAWREKKTIFVMGNGGSASTATHFACDLAKFTITPDKPRFKVFSLNDNIPLVSAWTNDSGFGSVFTEQMEPWLSKGDVVVEFSVHGGSGSGDAGAWSQNLVRATALAKARGAHVIGFSGFGGGLLKEQSDVCIVIPANEEPFGTPLVESFHVALHHLLCLALKLRIQSEGE